MEQVMVSYFLSDSHCKNIRGNTDGEIGFSILLKFESLFQIAYLYWGSLSDIW